MKIYNLGLLYQTALKAFRNMAVVFIPQLSLGFGAIQAPIRTKICAAPGQFWRLLEQFIKHSPQFKLLRMRGRSQMKRHRNFVVGVGNQVQTLIVFVSMGLRLASSAMSVLIRYSSFSLKSRPQ
jgi:hypothetical protein